MTSVTNNDIILNVKKNGIKGSSEWLIKQRKYTNDNCSENKKSFDSLCKRVYIKYQSLLKNKSKKGGIEQLNQFLSSEVKFPQKLESPRQYGRETSENVIFLQDKAESLKNVAEDLVEELNNSKEENSVLKHELSAVINTSRLKLSKVGNLKKLKQDLKASKNQVHHLARANTSLLLRLSSKNRELKRLRLKVNYEERCNTKYKEKLLFKTNEVNQLKDDVEGKEEEVISKNVNIQDLKTQLREMEDENNWLRSMVNDTLNCFDEQSRTYTSDLQNCVYELLNHNVSFSKVSPVIESVLKLVKCKPNRLPCKTTVNNMNIQRLALSHKHIADELASKKNLCLLSDETNKFGAKFEGMHATDETGTYWVLGIREMVTKAGKDILQTLLNILGDIDSTSEMSVNPVSRQILKNIVSTMSDRASTQTKFNELLEDFRTDLLKQDLGDHWDEMAQEEQLAVSQLCNFFCSLHALVHMAETSSKTLLEIENSTFNEPPVLDKSFRQRNEPGAVRLVRTCCKAFSKGGDEKNGQFQNFSTFIQDVLKENKFRSVPLDRFRGNRFNILFKNAGVVFFLKDHLTRFLEVECSNRLLAAVKHDLSVNEYVAGCKALGLISELITVPLWCIIENENIHIADSSAIYHELVQYLENFMDNCESFMNGTYLMSFTDMTKLNSPIFNCLTSEWEHDALVVGCLQILIPALCLLCRRLFKDFLPEGIWYNNSDIVKEKTVGVPKHNKFSESIFGHMDRLLREKPNTSQIAFEANIMFIHNKTLSWLENKTEKERELLVVQARGDVKKLRQAYKARNEQIEMGRRQMLIEKREKMQQTERAKVEKKEKLTDEIQIWGLWQTDEEIFSSLSRIPNKTEKVKALRCQLNFRQKVLRQNLKERSVFRFSKKEGNKTKPLSVEELSLNLKTLVKNAYEEVVAENDDDNMPVIVGKKIRHAFHADGELTWYTGQVISQVPGFPNWFNLKYSGDRAIYTYELMKEYQRGDLKLVI